MNLLLDECIDRRLAKQLKGHTVKTVPQMGWATTKNGRLLALAEGKLDVFVTVDRNLSFQQHCAATQATPFDADGRRGSWGYRRQTERERLVENRVKKSALFLPSQ